MDQAVDHSRGCGARAMAAGGEEELDHLSDRDDDEEEKRMNEDKDELFDEEMDEEDARFVDKEMRSKKSIVLLSISYGTIALTHRVLLLRQRRSRLGRCPELPRLLHTGLSGLPEVSN